MTVNVFGYSKNLMTRWVENILASSGSMKSSLPIISILAMAMLLSVLPVSAQSHKDSLSVSATISSTSVAASDSTDSGRVAAKGLKPLKSINEFVSSGKLFWAAVILILTYFSIRILSHLIRFLAEKSTKYRITLKGLIPLIRILLWVTAITFIIVGVFSPDFATIIAFSASIGVAVGFAAQDIIKNIFGGIMIIFDQPFKVGDKIEIGKYYGEVTEIGLRSTRIVTADDSLVSVPNAEIMNQSVSNANTGEANCQVVAEIYLPLDIDTERVRKIAIEGAQVSRYVFLNKPIVALFSQEINEKNSYLKMRLKAYVLDIRYEFAFKSDMTELVIKALMDDGIISKEDYQ